MKFKMYTVVLLTLMILHSCNSKKVELNDTFYNEWTTKTYKNADSQEKVDPECVNAIKKRINWIESFGLRSTSLDTLVGNLLSKKEKTLIIRENFYNLGISYGLTFNYGQKKYSIKIEGNDIVTTTEKKIDSVNDYITCQDIHVFEDRNINHKDKKISISIISHFELINEKWSLKEQCFY